MATSIDLVRDTTAQEISTTMQEIRDYLAVVAAASEAELADAMNSMTYAQIQTIVEHGLAESVYAIGNQINTTWTDTVTSTSYDNPLDIVAFETVTLEDGETVPGMILQAHYASRYAIMFDGYEAFYYAEDGLDAGTYSVMMGYTSGSITSGDYYQFTLTEAVPSGGLLAGFRLVASSSNDPLSKYVYSYDSDRTLIETVAIEEGSEDSGTLLGTFYANSSASSSGLNHAQRVFYGYNRWSQSAYRQYLNSSADAGSWWESQNDYDLPPDELSKYPGYMSGFDSDFLAALKKIKQTTALNTVEGLDDTSEDTYDYFFLPSLEQEYIVPQLEGVEGDYWPYWKQVLGLTDPQERYSSSTVTNANENHIRYAINSTSSAQYVRLRSAYRGYATNVWIVNSTGYVSNYSAYNAYRSAPACCIC